MSDDPVAADASVPELDPPFVPEDPVWLDLGQALEVLDREWCRRLVDVLAAEIIEVVRTEPDGDEYPEEVADLLAHWYARSDDLWPDGDRMGREFLLLESAARLGETLHGSLPESLTRPYALHAVEASRLAWVLEDAEEAARLCTVAQVLTDDPELVSQALVWSNLAASEGNPAGALVGLQRAITQSVDATTRDLAVAGAVYCLRLSERFQEAADLGMERWRVRGAEADDALVEEVALAQLMWAGQLRADEERDEEGYRRISALLPFLAQYDVDVRGVVRIGHAYACVFTGRVAEGQASLAAMTDEERSVDENPARIELLKAHIAHQDLDLESVDKHLRAAAAFVTPATSPLVRFELALFGTSLGNIRGESEMAGSLVRMWRDLQANTTVSDLFVLQMRVTEAARTGRLTRDDLAAYDKVVVGIVQSELDDGLLLWAHLCGATIAMAVKDLVRWPAIVSAARKVADRLRERPGYVQSELDEFFVGTLEAGVLALTSPRAAYQHVLGIVERIPHDSAPLREACELLLAGLSLTVDPVRALDHAVTALLIQRKLSVTVHSSTDRLRYAESSAMTRQCVIDAARKTNDLAILAEAIEVLRAQSLPEATIADSPAAVSISDVVGRSLGMRVQARVTADAVTLADPGPILMPWGVALARHFVDHPDVPAPLVILR